MPLTNLGVSPIAGEHGIIGEIQQGIDLQLALAQQYGENYIAGK